LFFLSTHKTFCFLTVPVLLGVYLALVCLSCKCIIIILLLFWWQPSWWQKTHYHLTVLLMGDTV
jgi:hypothetical protein